MEQPATIGIDRAKTVFQVHGVEAAGAAVVKRKLRRGQVLEFFAVTAEFEAAQKDDPLARRLATIPGVGTITASAIATTTPESATSARHGTTRRGSGSRRNRIRAGARTGWAGSRRRATDTCGGSSTLAR